MYNTSMMDFLEQNNSEDPEIGELKLWLSNASEDYLAYLKRAMKALLFIQKSESLPPEVDTLGYDKRD